MGRAHRSHHGARSRAPPVADEARRKRSEQQVMRAAATQDADCELDRASEAQRDRWFESNCHHHSAALENQGLHFFYPLGITAEGFTFFRVHFGDVNSSGRHSVHTVVWLSCRKIGVALLVESGKKASQKRCSGDALNLNYFRFSCSSRDRQTGRCHSTVTINYA